MNRRHFLGSAAAGVGLFGARGVWAQPAVVSTLDTLIGRAHRFIQWHSDVLLLRDRIAVADFSGPSSVPRFHIVDLVSGAITSDLVTHGKGSDPDHTGTLQRFSNDMGSLATSAGSYVTGDIYEGVHGTSMRLKGLDYANSNAENRAIVIHAAPYATPAHLAQWGKLGRSEGCFAVDPARLHEIMAMIGPGRMLYADRA
ncbi:MAG: murein L,D-transpeptidase catalytic domain family protein [Sphingomonadaceae bacterium]|nr:murein L,D-transpeptidase catalytic domain family protein [Sphingomonadaceae bacterium]